MDATTVPVRAVRRVGTDTVALELDTPPTFDARPGQFVKLGAEVDGEEYDRFYTISSPGVSGRRPDGQSDEDDAAGDTFEVTVGVDPEGDLSPWLADAEGEAVEISGPFGQSFYEDEARVVVVAGGPGVGPAVGIGERALADGNEVAIVYRDDDPAHEARLSGLAAGGADVFIVTDDGLADAIGTAVSDGEGQVFVYGFADFLDDALAALEDAGYDTERAKTENFG